MKVHGSWMCAAAVLGGAMLAGCTTPTTVTKFDVASQLEEKADKTTDVATKAKDYTDAIARYNEFIAQNQMVYKDLVPYAMYEIARCYRGLGRKAEAMTAYDRLMDKYPASKPAEWARPEKAELEKMQMMPISEPMPMRAPAPMSHK